MNCTPCPPCESDLPLTCEPYGKVSVGNRVVVEDDAFCTKTLTNPESKAFLVYDNGIKWGQPDQIYLEKSGGTMTGPLILDADPSVALGAATKQYVDNMVVTPTIPDGSITTPKLADLSVTTAKLAANSVDASKIPNLTITANKIADDQITEAKLGSTERLRIAKAWVNFDGTGVGTSGGIPATWSQSGTTVTVTTSIAHGLTVGQNLGSSAPQTGLFTVLSVVSPTIFTYTTTTTATNSGSSTIYPNPIRSSYNISSITKNGTGDYTVNFATPMADENYSVSSAIGGTVFTTMVGQIGRNGATPLFTTSNFKFTIVFNNAGNFTATDAPHIHLTIFGN